MRTPRLVVNPTLRLSVTFEASRRRIGRRKETTFDPEMLGLMMRSLHAASPALTRRLRRLGVIVRPSEVSQPVVLRAELAAATPLVPYTHRRLPATTALALNPRMWLQRGARPPRAIAERVARSPGRPPGTLWVEAPGPRTIAPFTPDPVVAALLAGRLALADVPAAQLAILRRAWVVLARGEARQRRAEWTAQLAACRTQLATAQFAVIRGLVNPVYLAALRRYTRALDREGHLQHGDEFEARHIRHTEPETLLLHDELVPVVNRIVPERIKASFSYLSCYQVGARLPAHRDREQCQWNVSLAIDAEPETDRRDAWPIVLAAGGRRRAIRLELGDGVLYSGRKTEHWRERQPRGHTSTFCFFCFVPAAFEGRLD